MGVTSSLIDQLLSGSSSLEGTDLSEAEKLGEEFTNLTEGEADATPGQKRAVFNYGSRRTHVDNDLLTEAMTSIQASTSQVPTSFRAIAKAAGQVQSRIKVPVLAAQVKAAGERLNRILAKTPEQMELDGAKTAKDYADPSLVPGWAKQIRADLSLVRHAVAKYGLADAVKVATKDGIPAITDSQVTHWVDTLLKAGIPHNAILDKIANASALTVPDKQLGVDYLNSHNEPNLGPDAFNQAGPDTHERVVPKLGAKTASVKAALVALDSREGKQTPLTVRQVNRRPAPEPLSKTASAAAPVYRSAQQLAASKTAAPTFTVADVTRYHNAGQPILKIAAFGMKKVGTVKAKQAVEAFIAGLKGSKAKIALTQIDCTALRNKLATSNAIAGASKCGSCSYRKGMHCGLTGGTLLSFPGMERQASNHKVASGAKSGGTILAEYELVSSPKVGDIAIDGPRYMDVEPGTAEANL